MARRVPSLEKLMRLTGFRPSTPLSVVIDKVTHGYASKRELVRPTLA